MVDADDLQPVAGELHFCAPERLGIDQVAVARRVAALVGEGHHLNRNLAVTLDRATHEPARLGRVVGLAVAPDRGRVPRLQDEGHGSTPLNRSVSLR